jgi:hypothetical protein
MINIYRYTALLLMVWTAAAGSCAWAGVMDATADIRFQGSSTLHDFEGTAEALPFVIRYSEDPASGKLIVTASTKLEVAGMSTENRKRDKNMSKMFDEEHFSIMEGLLKEVPLAEGEPTKALLHLKIRDIEKDVEVVVSNLERTEEKISCIMSFPVSLSDFGLKAPSVLGMIKVADTVQVECTICATPVKASSDS